MQDNRYDPNYSGPIYALHTLSESAPSTCPGIDGSPVYSPGIDDQHHVSDDETDVSDLDSVLTSLSQANSAFTSPTHADWHHLSFSTPTSSQPSTLEKRRVEVLHQVREPLPSPYKDPSLRKMKMTREEPRELDVSVSDTSIDSTPDS
ncbi:hypothetical protein PROFUN_03482 [Planoprotostelium fungivorum]|uniref:Uncharacterized protein n=1 Tax=Planoprotostelium fungivorum TaxID=1890364 RepID=A0A2P6MN85_9EUKA|nr:hypothetical protein PROFUN_03482 [Planoprotostelium fungivorum]